MTEKERPGDPRYGSQDTGTGRSEPRSPGHGDRDTASARSSSTPDALTIIDPSPARTTPRQPKNGLDVL